MKVRSNEKNRVFEIPVGMSGTPFLRELKKQSPNFKVLALSDDGRLAFVLTLGELDLDHWSLVKLNPQPDESTAPLQAVGT